ncbi:MAG: hypothetical protein L0Y55_19745 [Anaerolineales bacterium]|nr:hypothetical protein [Anaerolineales bacterium]
MKSSFKLKLGLLVTAILAIALELFIFGVVKLPVSSTTIALGSSTIVPEQRRPNQLEIHLLAVKHGDAQLIISPTGETLLIDAGRAG